MTTKIVILDPDDLADSWEMEHFDTLDYDGMSDPDYDGLVNLVEQKEDTDPTNWDADENGYPLSMFYHSDGDGLSDFDELRYGTDPFTIDSDGDGVNDATEVTNGSDPADADDQANPTNCLSLELVVGDHSASESERYELKVGANVRHVAPQWGKLNTNTYAFVKGKENPFEVHWINTAPGKETDYDYTSLIGGLSGSGSGDGFIVDDPEGILGVHGESTFDFAAGKSGTLYVIRVDVTDCLTYTNPATSTETKYEIASIPDREDTNTWTAELQGTDARMDVTIKYERSGSEADVAWEGTPGDIYFTNGELNVDIVLLDGSNSTPKMVIISGVLEINSVQQGDRIIVEESTSGCRDEVAVVKNFTWNDLQRLGTNNLEFAPEYSSLNVDLRQAVVNTIIFCLDQTLGRAQSIQRTNNVMADIRSLTNYYTNFPATYTNVCLLDIPSALGVGFFSDDYEHWHIGLMTNYPPPDIVSARITISGLNSTYTNDYETMEAALRTSLIDIMNKCASSPIPSLAVSHTYERVYDNEKYVDLEGSKKILVGDPIRNIRTVLADKDPELFFPGEEESVDWEHLPPVEVWQAHFFVNREGKIVIFGSTDTFDGEGQILNACEED